MGVDLLARIFLRPTGMSKEAAYRIIQESLGRGGAKFGGAPGEEIFECEGQRVPLLPHVGAVGDHPDVLRVALRFSKGILDDTDPICLRHFLEQGLIPLFDRLSGVFGYLDTDVNSQKEPDIGLAALGMVPDIYWINIYPRSMVTRVGLERFIRGKGGFEMDGGRPVITSSNGTVAWRLAARSPLDWNRFMAMSPAERLDLFGLA